MGYKLGQIPTNFNYGYCFPKLQVLVAQPGLRGAIGAGGKTVSGWEWGLMQMLAVVEAANLPQIGVEAIGGGVIPPIAIEPKFKQGGVGGP